jgi:Flp pilus assembly protein TadD
MFNSRNVHVLILGVILGSAAAYVYSSVRAESRRLVLAGEARDRLAGSPADPHAGVTDRDMQVMFEQALAAAPEDRDLLTRYATFLFDIRRFGEAADVFERLLEQAPDDAETRTYMATSLYAAGDRERAMSEFQRALDSDPGQILALHNLALGHLDLDQDADAAREVLGRIEAIDPAYEGIPSLRQRIEAAGLN